MAFGWSNYWEWLDCEFFSWMIWAPLDGFFWDFHWICGYEWVVVNISQLGWLFTIYGKIKHVPNHQSDMFIIWIHWDLYTLMECSCQIPSDLDFEWFSYISPAASKTFRAIDLGVAFGGPNVCIWATFNGYKILHNDIFTHEWYSFWIK